MPTRGKLIACAAFVAIAVAFAMVWLGRTGASASPMLSPSADERRSPERAPPRALPGHAAMAVAEGASAAAPSRSALDDALALLRLRFVAYARENPAVQAFVDCVSQHPGDPTACREFENAVAFQVIEAFGLAEAFALDHTALDRETVAAFARAADQLRPPDSWLAWSVVTAHCELRRAECSLPDESVSSLDERTPAEAIVRLRAHQSTPFEQPTGAEEVADLAANLDADPRVRRSALLAVGHPSSADAVRSAARAFATSPELLRDSDDAQALGRSIGQCGRACVPAAALLGSTDNNAATEARMVAAMTSTDPEYLAAERDAACALPAGQAEDANLVALATRCAYHVQETRP